MWVIFYSDFSTFNWQQGTPEEAPPYGVIAIVQPDPDRRRNIMHGWDWYYYNDAEGNAPMWWGCDIHGLLDRMCHRLPVRALCQGRTVSNDVYQEIMTQADLLFRDHLAK